MKIEGTRSREPRKKEIGRSRSRLGGSAQLLDPLPTFDEALDSLELEGLFNRLDEVSGRLGRHPSRSLLLEYRGLVGELLRREGDASRLREDYRWRRSSRTRFVLVERAQEALDEIEVALGREGERVGLLELMEEVKGCLISLLL